MTVKELFGYSGGIVLSICTLPQIHLMYKTRSAKDVSLSYAILFFIGLSLTLVYMVLEEAIPGVITMTMETILSAVIVVLKLYLDRENALHSKSTNDGTEEHCDRTIVQM